jgi:hypothetical protein
MAEETHIAHRDLTAKVRGDSWRGIGLIQIRTKATADATPLAPANPVASAVMQFRAKPDDEVVALELSTTNEGIEILNDEEWRFNVPQVLDFPLGSGKWVWDFETTDSTGFIRTYLKGTLTITRDVTRP